MFKYEDIFSVQILLVLSWLVDVTVYLPTAKEAGKKYSTTGEIPSKMAPIIYFNKDENRDILLRVVKRCYILHGKHLKQFSATVCEL